MTLPYVPAWIRVASACHDLTRQDSPLRVTLPSTCHQLSTLRMPGCVITLTENVVQRVRPHFKISVDNVVGQCHMECCEQATETKYVDIHESYSNSTYTIPTKTREMLRC